jgi:hypothetical protein
VYDVRKRGMMIPIKGDRDICDELATASRNETVATNMKKNNIPTSCPIKKVSKPITDFMVLNPFPRKV